VIIPLLLIPQIILSGTLFSFDKLNEYISSKGKVPLVADVMVSRWAYEAMAVYQFSENKFQKPFFQNEKEKSMADFKAGYLADELRSRTQFLIDHAYAKDDSISKKKAYVMAVIQRALRVEPVGPDNGAVDPMQGRSPFDASVGQQLLAYLSAYKKEYQQTYNYNLMVQEKKMSYLEKHGWDPGWYKDRYFNESLSNLVRNANGINRVTEQDGRLIQLIDPIFQNANPEHPLDYRTAFFVPEKNLIGIRIKTFYFNLIAIWLMCAALYFALYGSLLKKVVHLPEFIHKLVNKLNRCKTHNNNL
jgi:hypothetical protein